MSLARLTGVLTGLALCASQVAAQQPVPHRRQTGMMDSSVMADHMRIHDSLDARLDSLMTRMNRATGERKLAAMADVLNELVAQRKAMRSGMQRMMDDGMMYRRRSPNPQPADSAGHKEHRPPS